MQRLVFLLLFIVLAFTVPPASADPSKNSDELVVAEARQGFSEILDLWRDEMFEELYDRTIPSGRYSRDYFLERMVNSIRKPACCWEKLQDVEAPSVSPGRVTIIARVGMEKDGAGIEFFTKSFELIKEGGVWKVPMADILSLAGPYTYRLLPRRVLEWPVP